MATPVPFEKHVSCSPLVRYPSFRLVVNHVLIHRLIKLAMVLVKDLLPLLMSAPSTQLERLLELTTLEIRIRYATRPWVVGFVHL